MDVARSRQNGSESGNVDEKRRKSGSGELDLVVTHLWLSIGWKGRCRPNGIRRAAIKP